LKQRKTFFSPGVPDFFHENAEPRESGDYFTCSIEIKQERSRSRISKLDRFALQ